MWTVDTVLPFYNIIWHIIILNATHNGNRVDLRANGYLIMT